MCSDLKILLFNIKTSFGEDYIILVFLQRLWEYCFRCVSVALRYKSNKKVFLHYRMCSRWEAFKRKKIILSSNKLILCHTIGFIIFLFFYLLMPTFLPQLYGYIIVKRVARFSLKNCLSVNCKKMMNESRFGEIKISNGHRHMRLCNCFN